MIKFECVTELSELQCLFPGEPFCDNVRYAAYKTEYGGNDFSLLFSLNGNICIIERIKSDKNEPSSDRRTASFGARFCFPPRC